MGFTFACHDGHFSSPLPRFVCVVGFSLSFSVGELNFDLFLTSSNNLTATVESNAAEKKMLHTKDSAPGPVPYAAWRLLPEVTVDAMLSYFYDILGTTESSNRNPEFAGQR